MYYIFAEGAVNAPISLDRGITPTLYMLVFLVGAMYFLIWRPEAKRRKKLEAKRSELKKGDRLILSGGIMATFQRKEGSNYIVMLHDGATMEVLPLAIQDVSVDSEKKSDKE